ncbi:Eukaryotic peptide chain release factor GTP-binding subunit ERF3A [Homalodisca vitripennis]|nr:Eukaryotic peptide chain release factor GTP-binding subunit ERF3A [Homalodisca vitripennis]
MANNVAPDSWETQADAAPGDAPDPNDMSAKFSTLNVNAAEFVPSFSFIPSQTDSNPQVENVETSSDTPVTNGHSQLTQQKMPLSPTDCARAVALVDSGLTLQEVENITGFPRSSISRAVIRFRLTGSYERRQGSGRNRTTSARNDRFDVSVSLRNRF